jgi:hypothetical protein
MHVFAHVALGGTRIEGGWNNLRFPQIGSLLWGMSLAEPPHEFSAFLGRSLV